MSETIEHDWSQALGYVSPERLESVGRDVRSLKKYSYEFMQLHDANQILDVGCGIGIDTVQMAELVNKNATVYGVDHDKNMLKQAEERASSAEVSCTIIHKYADVLALPFPDNFFDACRAERLFQNLSKSYDPSDALDEMLRVTKIGGRIVLMDADFGATSVDFEDFELEKRLLSFYANNLCPNGYAGRQFLRLFKSKDIKNITVNVFPVVLKQFSDSVLDDYLCQGALKAGIAKESEIEHWRKTLEKLSKEGKFYCSMNVVLVAGKKN